MQFKIWPVFEKISETDLKTETQSTVTENDPVLYRNKLTVHFINGEWWSWWLDDWQKPENGKNTSYRKPWKHFYKWFSNKDGSDHFVFPSTNGDTIFFRKDIKKVSVNITPMSEIKDEKKDE